MKFGIVCKRSLPLFSLWAFPNSLCVFIFHEIFSCLLKTGRTQVLGYIDDTMTDSGRFESVGETSSQTLGQA